MQMPYLPERPLDVLRRLSSGEVRAVLTSWGYFDYMSTS
jgi:hypothetical protein